MLMLSEEPLDSPAKRRFALASLVEERGPLLRVGSFERFSKEGLLIHVRCSCRMAPTS